MPPEEEFWSPYTGLDALCGNTLLIALDALVDAGYLDKADLPPKRPVADADFAHVSACSLRACARRHPSRVSQHWQANAVSCSSLTCGDCIMLC